MKKWFAMLLFAAMLATAACGFAQEHVTFTASAIETGGTQAFNNDAAYEHLNEMFDFDLEVYPVTWDNWAQKSNMWIAGGEMPDTVFWNFNYIEYLNYVDQGLLKALPEGWKETYPNLAKMVEATGLEEFIEVDGKVYCVPHVTFFLFAPMSECIWNKSLYVRKDWAEQVGMSVEAGQLVTLDWLGEFISKVQESDLSGNGNTIGLTGDPEDVARIFLFLENVDTKNPFYKKGGAYIWGPNDPNCVNGVKTLKSWYEQKWIDQDFYISSKADARNKLYAGLAAAMLEDGTIVTVDLRKNEFEAANPGLRFSDCVANVALCCDNGEWGGYSAGNYWAANLYSPDIDDEVFRRILAIQDYLCTKEGQEFVNLGIEGVDWKRDENGEYAILREPKEDGTYESIRTVYPSLYFYYTFGVLGDDFSFVDPSINPEIRENTTKLYERKAESTVRLPFDAYATLFSSDAKAQYSLDVNSEIVREVVTAGLDVESEWAKFIETNRPLWEPVLNDMNEGVQ